MLPCFCVQAGKRACGAKGDNMIKTLLVDDEELALEHLFEMTDWHAYGFEIVGMASNGDIAMKLFRRYQPELIISDVRMPGTTGIDLITEIRRLSQTVHVLFLSGYESFDYARRAVRLGIDDYILKSDLDEELLLSRLVPLREKIARETERRKYTLGSVLSELFHEKKDENYYRNILSEAEYIRILKRYYYVVFSVRKVPEFVREELVGFEDDCFTEEKMLEEAIIEEASLAGIDLKACFHIDKRSRLAVVELPEPVAGDGDVTAKLSSYAAAVCRGRECDRFYAHYDYQKKSIADFREFWSRTKITVMDDALQKAGYVAPLILRKESIAEESIPIEWTAEFLEKEMLSGKFDTVYRCLDRMKKAAGSQDSITYLWYAKLILSALVDFTHQDAQGALMSFSLYDKLREQKLYRADGMLSFLKEKTEQLQKGEIHKTNQQYSGNIARAIALIRQDFGNQDMSVGYISERVGLSEAWLSTKFKDETGIGISEYITNVRICEAKRLLEKSDMMIYEVSEQCGFTSSQYFSKVFKSMVGLTPNKYQKERR